MEEGEPSKPPAKRQHSGKEIVGSIFAEGPAENQKKEVDLQTIVARLDEIQSVQQMLLNQFEELVNMMKSYVPTWERLARQDLRMNLDPPEVVIPEDIQETRYPETGRNEAGPSGVAAVPAVAAGELGNVDLNEDSEEDDESDSDESLGYDWT